MSPPPAPPAAKEKGEKKLFGFAFACLMDDEGATIRDGPHELCVYKCDDRHKLLVRWHLLTYPIRS